MPNYYCDPDWHNGELARADYLILLTSRGGFSNAYAACDKHVGNALNTLNVTEEILRIRKVSHAGS